MQRLDVLWGFMRAVVCVCVCRVEVDVFGRAVLPTVCHGVDGEDVDGCLWS